MGLDIYFYKVKNVDNKLSIDEIHKIANKRAKDKVRSFCRRAVKRLQALNCEDYDNEYMKIMRRMGHYTLYSFKYEYMLNEVKPIEEVKKFFNDFICLTYREDDAYFRKVNFLYRYFEDKLEDECCFVTIDEIDDIIDRCNMVQENHELAEELLPTRAGFFFGSTDYDEYYFQDLDDVVTQLTALKKDFDYHNDVVYVVMSW